MKRTLGLFLVVIALAFGLSACGSDSNNGDSATEHIVAELPSESQGATEVSPESSEPTKQTEPTDSKGLEKEDTKEPLLCTISIDCVVATANLENIDPSKRDLLPLDGMILATVEVEFQPGDTVFDVLVKATREHKIHMEFSENPLLKSTYIEGIANLYEFDCGERSGWTYLVNGKGVGVGSSSFVLSDGDVIQWRYTCDGGDDVGVRAE